MFKYLIRAHKPLIAAILIDAIIFLVITLLYLVTNTADHLHNFLGEWQFGDKWSLQYSIFITYSFLCRFQFFFGLGIVGYLYSGSRFISLKRVLGKNKSQSLLVILLIFSLLVGVGFTVYNSFQLSFYGWYPFSRAFIWFGFIALLTVYHLAFYSNLKYIGWTKQGLIYLPILISSYGFYSLVHLTYFFTDSANKYYLSRIENISAPIQQVVLPSYSSDLYFIIIFILITTYLLLQSIIELKKVGY